MAGAGYKLFNSGDVLTAAQVNTYLMEQTVMVFNDAAARTTALSGVLSEGMISYLKDTNATEVYNGSAWVGITGDGDITGVTAGTGISGGGTTGTVTITNDMATTITASGDIIVGTGSGTYDNLPIGTTGQVLTADTTVSPYKVKWAAAAASGDTFAAGKNKIINGAFDWNQRAFTSITTNQGYGFDRWILQHNNVGTITYSAETFSPGTAPVAGYEAKNFARVATTGQTGSSAFAVVSQRIESVRTLANQTATISFWAKAGSGTPSISVELQQIFGTGGSPSSAVQTLFAKQAITTTWTRYSFTATVPSISGKTIGTTNDGYLELNFWTSAGSTWNTRTNSLGNQDATMDFWGVQIEAGSTATDFQTATGTLQGELAACQRYYFRTTAGNAYGRISNVWPSNSTTQVYPQINHPVTMRVAPTAVDYANVAVGDGVNIVVPSSITITAANTNVTALQCDATGLTQYRPYGILGNNNTAGYVGLSAEL